MFPPRDLNLDHGVSAANLPLRVRARKCLSARYRRDSGMIADLTPRCVVTRRVAAAFLGPIQNLSASLSADICLCQSCET